MKSIPFLLLITFFSTVLYGQDCTQDPKAQLAKNNISKHGSSPVCANAAQFYAYLCACKNKPRTTEQARNLKATLEQIKSSYNSYGSPCDGIGRITDPIPDCKVGASGNTANSQSSANIRPYDSPPDNLMEGILREFDPESYSSISYSKAMQAQGQRIVDGLTERVNQYSTLIQTNDPAALLADFQSKFSSLESIQANYEKESFDFGYQRGQELSNQLSSQDYEGAFINSISFLNSLGEMRRAEKELEARKKALEQQKQNRMFALYKKAWEKNNELLTTYRKRAAYAESLSDEQANFEYVYHLVCYMNSMTDKIDAGRDDWYINRCQAPNTIRSQGMPNNLISREIQLLNVAQRKYELYEKFDNRQVYLEAAISFTAKAINENPSANNYLELAKLYKESSNILAIVSLESAKSINPELFEIEPNISLFEETKRATIEEVNDAILYNNIYYLQSFVDVGLHKTIKIEGKTLLAYALTLDNPDAVQTILNYEATKLNQTELQIKLNQTMNLAAFLDASRSLERFKSLGVAFNLNQSEENPIDYAVKGLAPNAIKELIKEARFRNYFETKYNAHQIHVLLAAAENPLEAAIKLDALPVGRDSERLVEKMLNTESEKDDATYLEALASSFLAKSTIQNNERLSQKIKQVFLSEVLKPSPESKAALLLEKGLLNFENIPSIAELRGSSTYKETFEPIVDPLNTKQKLKELIVFGENSLEYTQELGVQDAQTPIMIEQFKEKLQTIESASSEAKDNVTYSYLLNKIIDPRGGKVPTAYYKEAQKLYNPDVYRTEDQKIEIIVSFLKKIRQHAFPYQLTYINANIKNLENKVVSNLDEQYAVAAFVQRLAMERNAVEIFNEKSAGKEQIHEKESIAIAAFKVGNYDLFNWLAAKFDVTEIKSVSGQSFLDLLVHEDLPLAYEESYLNESIRQKLSVRSDKIDLLKSQLEKIRSYETSMKLSIDQNLNITQTWEKQADMVEKTLRLFGVENDVRVSNNGGTLLHLMVELFLSDYAYDMYYYSQFEIDPSIKDGNGQTALELLKANKKEFINQPLNGVIDKNTKFQYKLEYTRVENWLSNY